MADRYSKSPSQMLAGVVGGAFGAAGGIGIASAYGTALMLTGPLGMAVGAAAFVLAYRQGSFAKMERATVHLRMAIDELELRLHGLPENAPPDVRNRLWAVYTDLVTRYQATVAPLIGQ